MTTLELFETYPKSALVMKQWYLNKLLDTVNDDNLPEDFKKIVRETGISDERIADLIDISPRGTFDIFDDNKIYISIVWSSSGFKFNVNGVANSESYKERKKAERDAMIEAFKLLNEKL